MAELLPSSDDESLGDDYDDVQPQLDAHTSSAVTVPRHEGTTAGATATAESRPTEDGEFLEALFSPRPSPALPDIVGQAPSPPLLASLPSSTQRDDGVAGPDDPKKPLVSARDFLMKFLPPSKRQSHLVTPAKKPRVAIETRQPLAVLTSPTSAGNKSCSSPPTPSIRDTRTPSSVRSSDGFWEEQTAQTATPPSPKKTYVSPFRRGGAFTTSRRVRSDSEYESNDAGSGGPRPKLMVLPEHVRGSSILSKNRPGDDDDDDDWFSDAKDVDLVESSRKSATKRQQPSSASNLSTPAKPPRRSFKRPRTGDGDSDDDDDDEGRWPRLPPSERKAGPLLLSSPGEAMQLQVCANINDYLFDYQREGVAFLYRAFARGTGAILGDEMGLGKTIQVIALLSAILDKTGGAIDKQVWRDKRRTRREQSELQPEVGLPENDAPILIVVPASLLHNWEAELNTWMCCDTVILHGKPGERTDIVNRIARGEYEIVICSYDILKISIDKLQSMPWRAVILDEMHCLKNPEAHLTKAVKQITCPRKLGLTGTLMQNNEKELHCLLDTIAPGVLGSWQEFRAYYGDDIKYGRKKSAVPEAVERSRKKEKKLRQVLVPYYLRRDKDINPQFQEIKKRDRVVFCDLTPLQLAAYKRILAMPEFELLRRGDETCDCGRDSKRSRKACCYQTPTALPPNPDGSPQRALIWERFHPDDEGCKSCPNCVGLVCVAHLLKLSNHMELLKVNPRDPPELQESAAAFARVAFGDDLDTVGGVQQVTSFQEMRALGTQTCGKMLVLEKLLAVWQRKRQKTLLFSRSTRMLDILQLFLVSKAISYSRLDGSTRVEERQALVNAFNQPDSPVSVFLISTKAGGLGLNLPSATNVVIFDPSWNPAHDCQAQDRAYRIGQTKDVQVYRLITLGTIEEMIYVRQIYKQQLSDTTLKGGKHKAPRYFEGVQGDRRQQGELFGIRNLLCWQEGGVLKGIQDAYQRDKNDLLIQDNQVQYDATAMAKAKAESKATSRKKSKASTQPNAVDGADEEMLDVADELVTGLVDDEPPSEHGHFTRQASDDTQVCVLPGATTLMHEEIVGEEQNGVDSSDSSLSEPDDEEPPLLRTSPKQTKITHHIKSRQKAPDSTSHIKPPAKRRSLDTLTSTRKAPPTAAARRQSLYIPKYL
ncbi:TPA: hypothetical protein N0F65_004734 [Lagenidium giganteum]|uniref:Uncharacterized protein n=1 Tax=Lagenidium giganteum TaxID=4803 RepID=A0AAV2YGT4_9STRA|nr:TPA: hypothetical protein N0F65_004734 [Lagenidium giganteum]